MCPGLWGRRFIEVHRRLSAFSLQINKANHMLTVTKRGRRRLQGSCLSPRPGRSGGAWGKGQCGSRGAGGALRMPAAQRGKDPGARAGWEEAAGATGQGAPGLESQGRRPHPGSAPRGAGSQQALLLTPPSTLRWYCRAYTCFTQETLGNPCGINEHYLLWAQ